MVVKVRLVNAKGKPILVEAETKTSTIGDVKKALGIEMGDLLYEPDEEGSVAEIKRGKITNVEVLPNDNCFFRRR